MKKIAIMTIDSLNYGNRLQNYALQSVINKLGDGDYQVETLQRNYVKSLTYRRIRTLMRKIVKKDAINEFHKFRKSITWSKYFVSEPYITENLTDLYDAFVIGSDQVWNITFPFVSQNDFLPMIDKHKKMSYSASFGISSIPDEYKERYSEWLSDIKHISVREDSGREIVKDLIDVDAKVVLDPTMLLSEDDWKIIENKPKGFKEEKYLCKYVLGNDYNSAVINSFAKEKGLTVVDVNKDYLIGPKEFVYLIHHADLICTDSFHATVFSFIFEKPFVIFDRKCRDEDMSSRIDTLCTKFKLEKNRYSNEEFDFTHVFVPDYKESKKILQIEQLKSIDYLKNALNDILY